MDNRRDRRSTFLRECRGISRYNVGLQIFWTCRQPLNIPYTIQQRSAARLFRKVVRHWAETVVSDGIGRMWVQLAAAQSVWMRQSRPYRPEWTVCEEKLGAWGERRWLINPLNTANLLLVRLFISRGCGVTSSKQYHNPGTWMYSWNKYKYSDKAQSLCQCQSDFFYNKWHYSQRGTCFGSSYLRRDKRMNDIL